MGLTTSLGPGPLAVDTALFIYWIEEQAPYADLVAPLFEAADSGRLELVTSALTLLEVLMVPYRSGNQALAERYEALLTRGRGLRIVTIDHPQLRAAAHLRARHGVRTPDALQLAAAIGAGCSTFVTNDRRLPALAGLRIVQLEELARG